jgi:hypothetical protein
MVLQRLPWTKPVLADDGQAEPGGRRFARVLASPAGAAPAPGPRDRMLLRMPAPPSPSAPVPATLAPAVVPFDSTKTFVGPNGTYYDERWRWMEWRGRNRSWNWPAALTFGGWLAYRRLYWAAAAYLGWIGLVVLMLLNDVSPRLAVVAQLAVAIVAGLYGNRLYQARFRRAAWQVAQQHEEHAARVAALAGRGGVDPRAPWIMALAGIGLAGLLIALDG